jgi:hypothetical protein
MSRRRENHTNTMGKVPEIEEKAAKEKRNKPQ